MGARAAQWELIDLAADPVPSSGPDIDPVIEHYTKVAEALATQSALMRRIGDGDETLLKGESADALRKRAKDSAGTMEKASVRYENLRAALADYRTDLETARSESWKAVTAAEAAAGDRAQAERQPDPLDEPRVEGADEPSAEDEEQSAARTRAIDAAGSDLSAAKEVMRKAQAAFDDAAQRAAARIRDGWGGDDLSSSDWDKFVYGFNQFLKVLVEVLGYLGIALAVLGLLFPGVGLILILGIVTAVASLIGSTILAIQGEAGWLNVILGVVGVLTIGVGAIVAKTISSGTKSVIASIRTGIGGQLKDSYRYLRNIEKFNSTTGPRPMPTRVTTDPPGGIGSRPMPTRADSAPVGGVGRPPTPTPPGGTMPPVPIRFNPAMNNRLDRISAFEDFARRPTDPLPSPGGGWAGSVKTWSQNWDWRKALGIKEASDFDALNARLWNLTGTGSGSAPAWLYFGAVTNTYGMVSGIFGAAHAPSDIVDIAGGDDPREDWGITDALYAGLNTPRLEFTGDVANADLPERPWEARR